MSVVTTILVTADSIDDDVRLETLDLPSVGGSKVDGRLVRNDLIHEAWGGWSSPEAAIWAGGFKNLDDQGALDLILTQPWQYPRDVAVFMKREHEDRFFAYDVNHNVLHAY